MKLTARQGEILESTVREYINSVKPVSSQILEGKYHFVVSPATIRIEMQKLVEADYLYQPHTSAGRIPTDKGYRFFVNKILGSDVVSLSNMPRLKDIVRKKRQSIFKRLSLITKALSEFSSNFIIACLKDKEFFSKEGWSYILKEPEFANRDFLLGFTDFLNDFEENIQEVKLNSKIRVYIGEEGHFSKEKDFSVIISQCNFSKSEKGIISIIGPKRMWYEENIRLINSLTNLLDNYE